MNLQDTTAIMSVVLQQGGFVTGGLNFDCKVRRESVDPVDLFLGHVGAMDCYALGLRKAAALQSTLPDMVQLRYQSWSNTDIGRKIEAGQASLEECAEFAQTNKEPVPTSAKQELFEIVRNQELYKL
jgi:xylose isomerase